jgi:hypothetical protein
LEPLSKERGTMMKSLLTTTAMVLHSKVAPKVAHPLHSTARFAHCGYFGLLFLEEHGLLSLVGGLLLVLAVVAMLLGEEVE